MNALISSTPASVSTEIPLFVSPATSQPSRGLQPLATTRVWGLDFAQIDMRQAIERADEIVASRQCSYFITANLNYLMLSAEKEALTPVNQMADAIIADGYPIVLRSWCGGDPLPGRVAGSDMIIELARLAETRGYRMFFLGAAPGVAHRATENLKRQFPNLQIAGWYAPPFRPLAEDEHEGLLESIRQSKTDILLVAFGQPKGERWIYDNYRKLGVSLSIQLGASFDFLAGTARRAPLFWQKIGCEWLYRSLCEPRRLAPRYARNILFLAGRLCADGALTLAAAVASLKNIRFCTRRASV